MNVRKFLLPTSLILAMVVVIALHEQGIMARLGWAAAVFITPGLIFGLYRLWNSRARLKDNMDMATDSFRALKVMRAHKKMEEIKNNGRRK